jgi:large subunit ribosomal protein L7Ae
MADKEMTKQLLDLIQQLSPMGMITYGFNKCEGLVAERKARIVILAADTSPFGFLIRIPLLCEDENVKYIYVRKRWDLAVACGRTNPISAVAITYTPENFLAKMESLSLEGQQSKDTINEKAIEMEQRIEALEDRIQEMLADDNLTLVDEDEDVDVQDDAGGYHDDDSETLEGYVSDKTVEEIAASIA